MAASIGSGWVPVIRRYTPGRVAPRANAMNRICWRASGLRVSIERRDSKRTARHCRFRVGHTSRSVLRPLGVVVPLEVATLHRLQGHGRLLPGGEGPDADRGPAAVRRLHGAVVEAVEP